MIARQHHRRESTNGRVIEVTATSTGRPGKSQRVPARWFFEYRLVKAGSSVMRVPKVIALPSAHPIVITNMVGGRR